MTQQRSRRILMQDVFNSDTELSLSNQLCGVEGATIMMFAVKCVQAGKVCFFPGRDIATHSYYFCSIVLN
jgi:hypothetical protein